MVNAAAAENLELLVLSGFVLLALVAAGFMLLVRHLWLSANPPDHDFGPPLVRLKRDELPPSDNPLAESLDRSFEQLATEAGLAGDSNTAFLVMMCVGTLTGGLVYIIWEDPLTAIGSTLTGMAVVIGVFVVLRAQRRRRISEQLAGLAEMLARAVRAGESLEYSLRAVSDRSSNPLKSELQRCVHAVEMGLPVSVALSSLGVRERLLDLRIFASVLGVHRQTGGHLAPALERLAVMFRARDRYRRQLRVATASARFAAFMLSLAGPLVFLYLAYDQDFSHRLFDSEDGRTALMIAAGLELLGLVWISTLLRNDV
jgi:tight adherence protein B